jgi:predicted lipoprotein with Yx(FWY)xxD motif
MNMKIKTIAAAASVVATIILAAVVIPAGLAGSSQGSRATVRVTNSPLGRILVDGHGRSLYAFAADTGRQSTCSGACATAWPPLISAGKPHARAGAKASLLGRTRRADGRWQVTYKRHPLYTFFKDTARGQTNGEGVTAFGAEWDLVSPAGARVEKDDGAMSGGNPTAPGGYGGYGP